MLIDASSPVLSPITFARRPTSTVSGRPCSSTAAGRRVSSVSGDLVAHVHQTAPSTVIPTALLRWLTRLRRSRRSRSPDGAFDGHPGGSTPLGDASSPVSSLITFARRRTSTVSGRPRSSTAAGRHVSSVSAGLVAHVCQTTHFDSLRTASFLNSRWTTRLIGLGRSCRSRSPDDPSPPVSSVYVVLKPCDKV